MVSWDHWPNPVHNDKQINIFVSAALTSLLFDTLADTVE